MQRSDQELSGIKNVQKHSRLKDACAAIPVPILLMDEVGMFVQV